MARKPIADGPIIARARVGLCDLDSIAGSRDRFQFCDKARGGAVIASAAKQSISPRKERMDCFVASAFARRRASADKRAPLRKRFAFVAGNDGD
jgi:hypothetical protein